MVDRLRALFVLWSAAPGGAETHTWHLCRRLREAEGVDARIVLLAGAGILADPMRSDGIPVDCLRAGGAAGALLRHRDFARHLAAERPDIVVTSRYGAESALLALTGYRGPKVVVEHGGSLLNPALSSSRRRWSEQAARRFFSPSTTAEICVSQFMSRLQLGAPHAPLLVVIANGVDTQVFFPADRPPASRSADAAYDETRPLVIGAVGTLTQEKGFATLLTAVAAATPQSQRALRVGVLGDGPARPSLDALATRLGLSDRVTFLGVSPEVASFWRRCDLACVPSSARCLESFGMVAAEAMACGVPVVASRQGGLAEVVADGETGRLVPPDEPDRLAEALLSYVRDPGLLRQHGKAARRRAVARFSFERTAPEYARLLHSLVAGRGPNERFEPRDETSG